LLYDYDWPTARVELEKAIELNPNFPDAYNLLGYYWEVMGRLDLAEAEMKQGRAAGPIIPVINMDLASLAYYEKRYDEAIRLDHDAQALDPDFVSLPFELGQAYERKGEYAQAIAACQERLEKYPDDPALLAVLGYTFARAGKKTEATVIKKKLEQMVQHRYVSPFMLAIFYTGLGDNDKAIEQLNAAFIAHDPQLIWINLDPELDPLHSDPRFTSLLQRLRIPLAG
jgi:tetratricopeptide (TPR) repeat protein